MRLLVVIAIIAAVSAQDCCPHNPARCVGDNRMGDLTLAPGFCLSVFANLNNVRTVDVQTDPRLGTVVFAGGSGANVNVLIDADNDGTSDRTVVVPSGQSRSMSTAFSPDGDLILGQGQRIVKFRSILDTIAAGQTPQPIVMYNEFGTSTHHGYRYVGFGPNGNLFISSGVPCNVCTPESQRCPTGAGAGCFYGTILQVNVTGRDTFARTDFQQWAQGVRNSVGFDWDPQDGSLWFAENGRDNWGNDRPPDELNHAPTPGLHFGFPYCHGVEPDPDFNPGNCNGYEPPAQPLGPHVAALGMTFYKGNSFPEGWNNGVYIAEHGSWNRSPFLGFRVTHVPVAGGQAQDYKILLEGFLTNPTFGTRWGRPSDVSTLPDGSIIIADEQANVVWRIAAFSKKDKKD